MPSHKGVAVSAIEVIQRENSTKIRVKPNKVKKSYKINYFFLQSVS